MKETERRSKVQADRSQAASDVRDAESQLRWARIELGWAESDVAVAARRLQDSREGFFGERKAAVELRVAEREVALLDTRQELSFA